MKIKYLSPLLAAVAVLAIETPVAQSIDSSWLSYCKRVRNDVRNTLNTHINKALGIVSNEIPNQAMKPQQGEQHYENFINA